MISDGAFAMTDESVGADKNEDIYHVIWRGGDNVVKIWLGESQEGYYDSKFQ